MADGAPSVDSAGLISSIPIGFTCAQIRVLVDVVAVAGAAAAGAVGFVVVVGAVARRPFLLPLPPVCSYIASNI